MRNAWVVLLGLGYSRRPPPGPSAPMTMTSAPILQVTEPPPKPGRVTYRRRTAANCQLQPSQHRASAAFAMAIPLHGYPAPPFHSREQVRAFDSAQLGGHLNGADARQGTQDVCAEVVQVLLRRKDPLGDQVAVAAGRGEQANLGPRHQRARHL